MLKKLIGKSPDYVGKIKDNLEARNFVTKEVRYVCIVAEAKTEAFHCSKYCLKFHYAYVPNRLTFRDVTFQYIQTSVVLTFASTSAFTPYIS